jgi:hypothetical protein
MKERVREREPSFPNVRYRAAAVTRTTRLLALFAGIAASSPFAADAAKAKASASPSPSPMVADTAAHPVVAGTGGLPATSGSPVVTATATPTPVRGEGLGKPILFRGDCTPGGGPAACRVTAIGFAGDGTLDPIPCDPASEEATRTKIAGRYFAPGTSLDIYVRGAAIGTFVVAAEDEPIHGCQARASGRRHGAPGNTYDFIALLPEDPVKLAAIQFPGNVTPEPKPIAATVFAGAEPVSVRQLRRMQDGKTSILVIDAASGADHAIVIAEGTGADPAGWKVVWSDAADSTHPAWVLVDAFDLGAEGHPEVLLERPHRGESSDWKLLGRGTGGWK